jgi:solute carrier family 27 fatty acid transporter 1/4
LKILRPAVIRNSRYFGAGFVFFEAAGLKDDDIVYIALPIYHSNGGMIGLGTTLVRGNTCVLRRKFSASNFWKDCIDHNCSVS